MTTGDSNSTTETATDSCRSNNGRELALELSEMREETNRRSAAADYEKEEDLYQILALRLAETQRHLEAMEIARDPNSEFSFEEILDELDEELVETDAGYTLELPDES